MPVKLEVQYCGGWGKLRESIASCLLESMDDCAQMAFCHGNMKNAVKSIYCRIYHVPVLMKVLWFLLSNLLVSPFSTQATEDNFSRYTSSCRNNHFTINSKWSASRIQAWLVTLRFVLETTSNWFTPSVLLVKEGQSRHKSVRCLSNSLRNTLDPTRSTRKPSCSAGDTILRHCFNASWC